MRRFIAATKNKAKLKEIKDILYEFPFKILSMEDVGIKKDIVENGSTFKENALIKASEIYKVTGETVMADDSGLEVDYLDGAPGVHSSRFAGEGKSDDEKSRKLLYLLKDVPFEKRTARFVCAIAVVFTDGRYFTVEGTCNGYIGLKPEGENGFGYDPIFYMPEYNMTTAQMKAEEKNKVSHRGKALNLMVEELKRQLALGGRL
jgi:XTP/dITP diphosphohydrolase